VPYKTIKNQQRKHKNSANYKTLKTLIKSIE